jgi:hypothetical protein
MNTIMFSAHPCWPRRFFSPGDDMNRKLMLCFENGAAEVWVIDDRKKTRHP